MVTSTTTATATTATTAIILRPFLFVPAKRPFYSVSTAIRSSYVYLPSVDIHVMFEDSESCLQMHL